MARTSLITLIFLSPGDFQDHVELGLLFLFSGAAGVAGRAGHHHRAAGGGLDAVFVLEDGFQFLGFEKGQTHDLFSKFLQISHCTVSVFLDVFQRRRR